MNGPSHNRAPPMPAEHGAWVVMLAPMLLVWLAFPPPVLPAVLLVVATVSAWLAQSTAPAARRARGGSAWIWLSVELAAFCLAALALVVAYRLWPLIPIGLAAAGFAALHTWMRTQVRGRRLDRSEAGELLGVAGLVLTGPAAYVVSRGSFDWTALWVMAICSAFFGSGVLFVQMLVRWLRARKNAHVSRWQVARSVLVYHGGLALLLLSVPAVLSTRTAVIVIGAFLPTIVRALWGVLSLRARGVPSFKIIGILESVYAVWFAALMSRVLPIAIG